MIQSMFSGASGIRAHQTQMDVIGNNISNINTVGFKSSRAEFKQALARTTRGGSAPSGGTGGVDPSQIGLGVAVGAIGTIQTQGPLQYTGRTLDMAIEGSGFLVLSDGSRNLFTRDGSLTVDADGTLVTSGNTGYKVMGWNANPNTGTIDTTAATQSIQLPIGAWALARQTSEVTYAGNLNASAADGTKVATTYQIYDSLGKTHNLKVTFTKSATAGQWTWTAESVDDKGAPDGAFPAAPSAGAGSGTITFNTEGKVASGGTASPILTLTTPGGANARIPLTLDFSKMTALAKSAENGVYSSNVTPTSQNGLPLGTLSSYSIDPTGTIIGTFSNGMTQAIAQIALADFTNSNGLVKTGGNVFIQSANSGLPQIGAPTSGGLGKLTSTYLEGSNVDLSVEFTNMIVAQRGFQANSRVVTTSDELLQELISLKR